MTSSIDSLEWKKPDGSQDYVENAQIYKNNVTKTEKDP